MNVSTTRADRRDNLAARAAERAMRADALTALSELVESTPCPVGRYELTWATVARRLRADAEHERRAAKHLRTRADDIDAAERARDAWVPRRGSP